MNKTPYDFAAESTQATLETLKEVSSINQRAMDKFVDFQFQILSNVLEGGLKQTNPYAGVKTVEELAETNSEIVKSAARQNLDSARKLVDIVTETRDAYSSIYEKGVTKAITPLTPKATKKAA